MPSIGWLLGSYERHVLAQLGCAFRAAGLLGLVTLSAVAQGNNSTGLQRLPESPRPDCHFAAAQFHRVHPEILRAILWNESGMRPSALNKNKNGTIDLGIGQHNSMHFAELQRLGVTPGMLTDACVGTYVAAWHLSKQQAALGNTWQAVGAYHSRTPIFNQAYANGVALTLAKWGQLPRGFIPFPSAPRNTAEALRIAGSRGAQPQNGVANKTKPAVASMVALSD